MRNLREIVAKSIYVDEPHFSDQVLLPALAAGHHVTLVTAFAPSYLLRLVDDLASSPEIEPGKLSIIFCIPFAENQNLGIARLVSAYLSASAHDAQQVKEFLDNSLSLIGEGGLSYGALISKKERLLTPSCVGLIQTGEVGSGDVITLIDATPGDYNSPIEISTSWDGDSPQFTRISKLVANAVYSSFADLRRLSHPELTEILKEIRKKGYPKLDFNSTIELARKTRVRKKTGRTLKTKSSSQDHFEDFEEAEIVEALDSTYMFDIERILAEVELREAGLDDEDVAAFLGDLPLSHLSPLGGNRAHVPPLHPDLVGVVGHGYAECWCGAEFNRESGCPEGIY